MLHDSAYSEFVKTGSAKPTPAMDNTLPAVVTDPNGPAREGSDEGIPEENNEETPAPLQVR